MTRACSICGLSGHNKRTCSEVARVARATRARRAACQLPTSIFAEWVDRGWGEWMDINEPLANVPTIDLTSTTLVGSGKELELTRLAIMWGIPTEIMSMISLMAFSAPFPLLCQIRQEELLEIPHWTRIYETKTLENASTLTMTYTIGQSEGQKKCVDDGRMWSIERSMMERDFICHSPSSFAKLIFPKGNSKAKSQFTLHMEAVCQTIPSPSQYNTAKCYSKPNPYSDPTHRKPFKRLSRGSWNKYGLY